MLKFCLFSASLAVLPISMHSRNMISEVLNGQLILLPDILSPPVDYSSRSDWLMLQALLDFVTYLILWHIWFCNFFTNYQRHIILTACHGTERPALSGLMTFNSEENMIAWFMWPYVASASHHHRPIGPLDPPPHPSEPRGVEVAKKGVGHCAALWVF